MLPDWWRLFRASLFINPYCICFSLAHGVPAPALAMFLGSVGSVFARV